MNENSQSLYTLFLQYTMLILLNTRGQPPSACGFARSPFYYGENSRRVFVVFNLRLQIDTDVPLLRNVPTSSRSEYSVVEFTPYKGEKEK